MIVACGRRRQEEEEEGINIKITIPIINNNNNNNSNQNNNNNTQKKVSAGHVRMQRTHATHAVGQAEEEDGGE
jgi:hypothetical protein